MPSKNIWAGMKACQYKWNNVAPYSVFHFNKRSLHNSIKKTKREHSFAGMFSLFITLFFNSKCLSAVARRVTTACGAVRILQATLFRREELVNGEFNSSECIAGTFCIAGALAFWHTEVVCRNEHLYIAFKLNNCENAQCDNDCALAGLGKIVCKCADKPSANAFGNFAFKAVANIARVGYACIENYRVNSLNLGSRVCIRHFKLNIVFV